MTRYRFVPAESRLFIHASSSIHGISTDADGVEGSVELTIRADGSIDPTRPRRGSLRFEIARLSSGNPLYDIETERRIDARRYPLVEAALSRLDVIGPTDDATGVRCAVAGTLSFHGVSRSLDGEIEVRRLAEKALRITGERVLDVRDWDIHPPRLGLIKVHPEVQVRLEAVARS